MTKFSEIIKDPKERKQIKDFKDEWNAQEVKIWEDGKLIFNWVNNE